MILDNNIMWNKSVRDRFDDVWNSLKGLKAGEIEYQIQMSRRIAEPILGTSDIDKIRNSSLLRLLLYEFIIFADEKCLEKTTQSLKRSTVSSSNQSNADISITSIKDLKEILSSVEKRRDASGYYQMEKYEFKTLKRRVKIIEQELKESSIRSRPDSSDSHDPDGTEAMIEQLEHLLKKKEKRIKELNSQLEENFQDKEELQIEIQALEEKNLKLQQTARLLDEECINIREAFQKYKAQQKEDFLLGASEFINGGFSRKDCELSKEDSLHQRPSPGSPQFNQILSSTQALSKYVNASMEKQEEIIETPSKEVEIQQKTVKKACITRVISEEYHGQEEENLLESMRIYRKKSQISKKVDFLQNNQHSLDRMLLAQAAFIERVMESII